MPDAECMTRELRVSVGLTAALVTATVVALLIVPPAQPLARSAGATNTGVAEAQAARSAKTLLSHRVGVSIVRKQSTGTTFAWTVKRADRVWCSLDGGTAGKCSSPKAYPGLRSGRHSFVVSGWNKRTAESMMVTWTAGQARPHRAHTVSTFLRAKNTLPGSLRLGLVKLPTTTTASKRATFAWTVDGAVAVSCSLDRGRVRPCAGSIAYSGLRRGRHSFVVTARNKSAMRSTTAVWTVTSGKARSARRSTLRGLGTVREAGPGQVASVIAASAAGDTVRCKGGVQPKLTLTKSFPAPGITVTCDAGSYFQGIDTNGQSGYTFDAIESRLPVEVNDYNITPFYLHGNSERITLTGAFKLSGGYDAIKVYGGCKDCVIDDGGAASDVTGFGGDGIHLNGFTNMRIVSIHIHDPYNGYTPEHNDGIQAQAGTGLYIGPGVRLNATNGPRSDIDSAGIFINSEGGLSNVTIDAPKIQSWQIGRAIQVLGVNGTTILKNLTITDCGTSNSPPITLGANTTDQRFDLTGIARKHVYFNDEIAKNQTAWH